MLGRGLQCIGVLCTHVHLLGALRHVLRTPAEVQWTLVIVFLP